ncbi:MAG: Wzz/FepE/Etk N-terminal domain-containing protein [Anaeromyxobacteraceae bacterium]|nr:Wzz/FepE/Etk N-terminal domain-containing protein [Anaeromyxobacteraceae bacterium]
MSEHSATPPAAPGRRDAYVDPLDLLAQLGRRRRWLVLWPLLAGLAAAGVSMALPKRYTAMTRLMPPQQGQSGAAAMLSQLGGLAGAAGGALGLKNPGDLYVGMLASRTVADALVTRFKLQEHYGQRYLVDTRKALAGDTRLRAEKNGIITIEVDARDPTMAAELANAYVAELNRLTSSLAVSEAAQRRLFFERHLQQTKERLAQAESDLRSAIDTGGLVSVDAQSRATVETVARLRAEISAREIQAQAMRAYATADHPELRRVEQELTSMRQALTRLESGAPGGRAPTTGGPDKGAAGLGTIKLVREVKYHEVMMELLARQYELARVDESKEAPIVQVLDPAEPPEKRSWPKRTLIVLTTTLTALIVAVAAALVSGALEATLADPARRARLEALRSAWRWRQP